jgi:hypothetical protein
MIGSSTKENNMRILVSGSRECLNYEYMSKILSDYTDAETVIIHGGARGADSMAGKYASEKGLKVQVYPADWNKHGKAAGPIRNQQMLDEGKPDMVIAFPGDGNGTWNMINIARKANVPVRIYKEWRDNAD